MLTSAWFPSFRLLTDPSGSPCGGLFGIAELYQAGPEVWQVHPEACDLLRAMEND